MMEARKNPVVLTCPAPDLELPLDPPLEEDYRKNIISFQSQLFKSEINSPKEQSWSWWWVPTWRDLKLLRFGLKRWR
jgi:hypothetical protein